MLSGAQKIYSFWGRHSKFYAFVTFFTFLGREKFLRRKTVKKLGLSKGATVLDLACGTGRNFHFLEEVVGENGRIIGFDYSPEMLNAARQLALSNKWQNIELIQGDAAQLDIKQKDIDGAISILGLSAMLNCATAIVRVYDALNKGGAFVVCDAKCFEGLISLINPLIKALYEKWAVWNWKENVPKEMERIFGNVAVEKFLSGAFYIAKSIK